MAVKIRLQMTGKRNRRNFRIVVVDESKKRDGAVIEMVGTVNPLVKPTLVTLKKDRIAYWQEKGALPTERVKKILTAQTS